MHDLVVMLCNSTPTTSKNIDKISFPPAPLRTKKVQAGGSNTQKVIIEAAAHLLGS